MENIEIKNDKSKDILGKSLNEIDHTNINKDYNENEKKEK